MNEETTTRGTTCPRCGKVVDPYARFCKYCAFDLAQSEQRSQTTTAQQSFCPHCGGEVGDKAVFCGSCSGTLPAAQERAPANVQKSRLGAALIACFAIGGIVVLCLLFLLFGSRKSPQIVVAKSSNSSEQSVSSTSTSSRTTQTDTNQLTNAKVEDAVGSMVSNLRVGGSFRVEGIQELPQENAATADIRFDGFQYKADMAGTPVTKDKQSPKEPDIKSPNYYDEVYKYGTQQVGVKSYSGPGRAVLKRYNDGRWVLKEVHWQFNAWVGSVDIR